MKKLKRNLNELFEKGILFIKNIKRDEKTFLIYHKDADGICSAAILLKALEKFNLKPTKIIASSNEEIEGIIKKIKDFDKTIILDIDICYLKKELDELNKDILFIDHHPPRADLNSEKIVYINPRFESPKIYRPVSYVVLKLFSKVMNLQDIEWLATLGTIGDLGFEDCKDLLEKWINVKNKYGLTKTAFWKDIEKLNGSITIFGFDQTLNLLRSFDSLNDLRKNIKIKKAYKKFIRKYNDMRQLFLKNAKTIKEANLVISEIRSEHRGLSSLISTNMAIKHPGTVIVLMRFTGSKCAINARYEEEWLNLGKIMEKCAKGLNGGGGHANAAGATIKTRNKEIFKERLIKKLKKFSKKD